jgi:hypothetical protein
VGVPELVRQSTAHRERLLEFSVGACIPHDEM